MIRAIIFDCYGVLVHGSLDYLRTLAHDTNALQSFNDLTSAADRGYVAPDEYIQQAALLFGRSAAEIRDVVNAQEVKNPSMLTYVTSLRSDFKVALLSNVGRGWLEHLFTPDELAASFDAVVLSGETGVAKPYKEAFDLVAANLGVTPGECIMIDDGARNVEGAELAGMYGILFTSERQLKTDLDQLLKEQNA